MYKLYTSACYGDRSQLIDGTLIRLRLGLSAANQSAAQSEWGLMGAEFERSCWHSSRIAVWDSLESVWRPELPPVGERFCFSGRNFPQVCEGFDTRCKRHYFELASGNTGASSCRVWSAALQTGLFTRPSALSLPLIDADCVFTVNMRQYIGLLAIIF